ncbi:hypothetical protein HMPREF9318_00320 [Streptococcus urinalis FB127-CNA-2]|uniref:Membrane protein n=1 Tax=Streptococcus urinalis 2285-97 TaxID=764291 RepID=G5KFR0_9STRE|nr:AI-2E family transporter [Streptococcus urinalis]EHJ57700.1 putative membrane protein [Streptococcus urinalis 2285-97]EKS22122.1 hypothetical protein HMPREF9318_00320 [Streptococcus urinalis FB127-CNA-2]VEF31934.1 membrane protein [Streptococcus urinalis]
MKFEKRQVALIVLAFVICYAIQSYWSFGSDVVSTTFHASKPFLVGAALAFIVNIVMNLYESVYTRFVKSKKLLRAKRPICLILSYLTFLAVIVYIFSIVLPDLIASITSLLQVDPKIFSDFVEELNDNKQIAKLINYLGSNADVSAAVSNYSHQVLKQVLSVLTNMLTSVTTIASTVLNVFISFVFSIYVLANKEQLGRQFNLLVDTYTGKYASTIHYVVNILNFRFHRFFIGQSMDAIILGTLTAVGMMIFKLPFAATIGVLVGFSALIPVFGAFIGASIGFILILTESFPKAVFFIIFIVILQQFEGNVIYPRVVGNSIGLPGMWVILAITIGGALWNIPGMLVAVPLAASLYQILKDHIIKKSLKTNV